MTEYYEKARAFAQEFIEPWAKQVDEEARFATEAFEKIAEAGYLTLVIPEQFGGQGKGVEEHVDVCRAFAESCASVGLCYMMHNVFLFELNSVGHDELKAEVFKDVVENNALCALAMSEFTTGAHFYKPYCDVELHDGIATLNGKKSMVTSGGSATYYSLGTVSQKDGESDHWVVKLNDEGVNFRLDLWDSLGMRANVSCPMELTNVKLPEYRRIGEPGAGGKETPDVLVIPFVAGLAAVYTGVCQAACAEATKRVNSRRYHLGKHLKDYDAVQIHISDMYTKTQACIALTNEATRAFCAGEPAGVPQVMAARLLAIESSIEVTRTGMILGAGMAYAKHGIMERLLRDAFGGQIMAPGKDVLNLWLGRVLLDLPFIVPEDLA